MDTRGAFPATAGDVVAEDHGDNELSEGRGPFPVRGAGSFHLRAAAFGCCAASVEAPRPPSREGGIMSERTTRPDEATPVAAGVPTPRAESQRGPYKVFRKMGEHERPEDFANRLIRDLDLLRYLKTP